MNRNIIRYIAVITIGIGFILMAASNTLRNEIASTLQAVSGALFIIAAIIKIVSEKQKND